MAVTTPEAPASTPEDQAPAETPAGDRERLFNWQTWVHVGPEASKCEEVSEDPVAPKNECGNPLHFHAWIHVPNQFEHEDCREKALAAKARRMRLLRDPKSDAHDMLEGEVDELAAAGERARVELVNTLTQRDVWLAYQEALRDTLEWEDKDQDPDDEGVYPKPYEGIFHDQERFAAIEALPEDERPADEHAELERHIQAFLDRVDSRRDEILKPLLEGYEAKDISTIIDEYREHRIRQEGDKVFSSVYSHQEWLLCTLRTPAGARVFADEAALRAIAPEVYGNLQAAYDELERDQNEVIARGNS